MERFLSAETQRTCQQCRVQLPPAFFPLSQLSPRCHSCRSDYDRQRHLKKQPQAPPPAEKRCTHCEQVKPAARFYRDSRTSTGLHSLCIPCGRAKGRKNLVLNDLVPPPAAALPSAQICFNCGEEKPADEFDRRADSTGLQRVCRRCQLDASLQSVAKPPAPPQALPPTKVSLACREGKPRVAFSLCRSRDDGLQPYCKPCSRRSAARRASRPAVTDSGSASMLPTECAPAPYSCLTQISQQYPLEQH